MGQLWTRVLSTSPSTGITVQRVLLGPDKGTVIVVDPNGRDAHSAFHPARPRLLSHYQALLLTIVEAELERAESPVVHLGSAGMAVARAIAEERPGLSQVAVDIDRQTQNFITKHWPPGDAVLTIAGDAREHAAGSLVDDAVVVLDVGADDDLESSVLRSLGDRPRGVLVNVHRRRGAEASGRALLDLLPTGSSALVHSTGNNVLLVGSPLGPLPEHIDWAELET